MCGHEQKYNKLAKQILACRACWDDFGFEPNPIICGGVHAKIVQIGQAPSKLVDQIGTPFMDQSGDKLKREWYNLTDEQFYNPNNFYIASMSHCYPGKNPNGNGDRKPPKRCARLWMQKELDLIENEIYILVGAYATKHFFPKSQLTDLVFSNQEINGKCAFILPHPSPLNRRWFAKYPQFEAERIPEIRRIVQEVLFGEVHA